MSKEATQFKPGNPGGMTGRIMKKSVDKRLDTALEAIVEKVLEKALGGDMHACDTLLRFYSRKDLV